MRKAIPWIVVGAVVLGFAVFAFRPAGAKVTVVDSQGVLQADKQGVRIVDVRSPAEFAGGHVPHAQNVPLNSLEATAAGWNKAAPVLVYCQTGARSTQAVKILSKLGFKQILHFKEGIQGWTGLLEQGGLSAAAPTLKPTALPVMYEFYTGW